MVPLPTQFFQFTQFSPPSRKGKGLEGIMYIHLQTYEIIFVFLLGHFDDFWMFLQFFMFDMIFCKDFCTFLQPNKTQGRE